ncbi:thioredoxin-dependent thiol peroxidase [Paraferrimonas sp. SM1919]|uniref:thioredoxin-dependent thiol peroxidase n=1 Tax=Paraferrimonas sp. SM1919 TaxID=2662263 RepID=UPI001F090914|nr:thioredoxin-dependent thiol peroxidase [Paraferrimonas sp. SM1919]
MGSDVPKFILPDQHQQLHNIEDVIGKKRIIIYFYPQAATPGCTVQAQGLRDIKNQLDQQNVAVFGISPDKPAKLLKFAEKEQLNFTLLSDVDHQVAEQFGIWGLKQFMGRQFDGIHRITFVIGLDGKIEQILNKFKTKDHHQVVLENL